MHLIIGSGQQIWGSPPTWELGWVLTSALTKCYTGPLNYLGSFEKSKQYAIGMNFGTWKPRSIEISTQQHFGDVCKILRTTLLSSYLVFIVLRL
jgi:hypothetical protein